MSQTLTEITGIAGAQNLEKPRTVFARFTAACERLIRQILTLTLLMACVTKTDTTNSFSVKLCFYLLLMVRTTHSYCPQFCIYCMKLANYH